jgi:hypothetical protein
MRFASLIAAIALFSSGAHAVAAHAAVQMPAKHASHARLTDWHKYLKPGALKKLQDAGAHIAQQLQSPGMQAKAHDIAVAKIKQLFPKADAGTVDRAVALALHHGAELFHKQLDALHKQHGANMTAAVKAKFSAMLQHHAHIDQMLKGVMSKIPAAAKGERLGKL